MNEAQDFGQAMMTSLDTAMATTAPPGRLPLAMLLDLKARRGALEHLIWDEPEAARRWRGRFAYTVRLLIVLVRDIASGQLTMRAMSLVYTTLLSIVPLLALSFSVLKAFGVHQQIEPCSPPAGAAGRTRRRGDRSHHSVH